MEMQTWMDMSKPLSPGGKQALIFLIISGGILSSFLIGAVATNQLSLSRPRWNVPVLRLGNETILIEAKTSFPLANVNDFSARLVSPLGVFPLDISSITQDLNDIQASASFPAGIKPDVLYDLEISVGGLTDVQRHAVKVLSEYKQEFKVIVWCDTQVGYSEEYENIWEDTYLFIEEMVNQANLIDPEFVMLLGDITETALRSEYQFMYDQCMRLNVPVYVGVGNHDSFDAFEFQRWCGYFNFTFDYGPDYHFIYIDTGIHLDALRDQYLAWLDNDLAAHAATPLNVVMGHAPPYQCSGRDQTRINKNFENLNAEFVNVLNQRNVRNYLYGHDHMDQNKYPNCTIVTEGAQPASMRMLQTASGRESAAYRLLHFKDKQLVNATTRNSTTSYERNQASSFRCFADTSPTNARPDLSSKNLVVDVNASVANDITRAAVPGVDCNVTSRFPEKSFDDFTAMTVGFWITSTGIPNTWSNRTISASAFQRAGSSNEWWIKITFDLANGEGINIKAWGA